MDRNDCSNSGDSSRPRSSFLRKLYEMVDDPSTDSIVSWSQSGKSFIVWNESEFCRDVLPRCLLFKEMKYFAQRLEYMGFTKVDSEQWEFASSFFVRGNHDPTPPQSFLPIITPEIRRKMERQTQIVMAYRAQGDEDDEGVLGISDLKCLGMDLDDISHRGDSSRPRPCFLRKLYEMVDDPSTDSVVSWSQSGKSFIVWNESEFCGDVLPRCLLYQEMKYFVQRLEVLGFTKVDSEQWEYASNYFVRGNPDPTPPRPFPLPKRNPELRREMERQVKKLMAYRAQI